jgi:predicted DNA-binding transcriptional regulator AlpA
MLNISTRSVWRLVAAGDLTPPAKIGGSSQFVRAEVESYMAAAMKGRRKADSFLVSFADHPANR